MPDAIGRENRAEKERDSTFHPVEKRMGILEQIMLCKVPDDIEMVGKLIKEFNSLRKRGTESGKEGIRENLLLWRGSGDRSGHHDL